MKNRGRYTYFSRPEIGIPSPIFPSPILQQKKAVSFETAFLFEDAASSTALSCCLPFFVLAFLSVRVFDSGTSTLLVPGYPGHHELLSFRVQSVRSDCFGFRLSLSVSTNSSAVRIHRPRHLPRLGPLPAGRLSTSELVGAWGKAPISNLDRSPSNAILSDVTFGC